jgi:hypothetical protein
MGRMEVQIYVVSADTLMDAQKNPVDKRIHRAGGRFSCTCGAAPGEPERPHQPDGSEYVTPQKRVCASFG